MRRIAFPVRRRLGTLLTLLLGGDWVALDEGLALASSAAECIERARTSPSARVAVSLAVPITDAVLGELESHGTVHGWIDRFRMVSMTPSSPDSRAAIASLPSVESLDVDAPICPASAGTYALDLVDITNVEESGAVGDPDAREVAQTGAGVHVAILDTGFTPGWQEILPEEKVAVSLARSFFGGGPPSGGHVNEFQVQDPPDAWQRDHDGHGLAVAQMVAGFRHGGTLVDGAAPGAKIIPLRVLDPSIFVFTSHLVAALDYLIGLVESRSVGPVVANISLLIVGGNQPFVVAPSTPNAIVERAINEAIAAGIIVVAAAGNDGEAGMVWPAAYPQVISVGATGWTRRWRPLQGGLINTAFWWNQDVRFDPDPRRGAAEESESFVSGFSGRAIPSAAQELDLLAPADPAVFVFDTPDLSGLIFGGGTSFASPLVAGVAALILQKNPRLSQPQVESILRSSTRPMAPDDSRPGVLGAGVERTEAWDSDCGGHPCDPVGAGLVQADRALAATPKR